MSSPWEQTLSPSANGNRTMTVMHKPLSKTVIEQRRESENRSLKGYYKIK